MKKISYANYRFPPEIQQAIWLYLRFTLSFRDVEDLLAERGVTVSYETIRRWVNHFGPKIAAELRKRRPSPDRTWHLDEVHLKIAGRADPTTPRGADMETVEIRSFDPETLALLREAFDLAWAKIPPEQETAVSKSNCS